MRFLPAICIKARSSQEHRSDITQISTSPRVTHIGANNAPQRRDGTCGTLIVLLGITFALLAAAVVTIYVFMRDITSSTEKFETVPCYVVIMQVRIHL